MKFIFCLLALAHLAAGVPPVTKEPVTGKANTTEIITKPTICWPQRDCCDKRNVNVNMFPRWTRLLYQRVRSWMDCCKLCKITPGCGHWAYNGRRGVCYIYGIKYMQMSRWISGYCPPWEVPITKPPTLATALPLNETPVPIK